MSFKRGYINNIIKKKRMCINLNINIKNLRKKHIKDALIKK